MRLSIVADPPDNAVRTTAEKLRCAVRVSDLAALVAYLEGLPRLPVPATLDVVAHTTKDRLMRLGSTVIDPAVPAVATTFARLAHGNVLPRLGITALRLLGCWSGTGRGAAAVIAIADRLGVRVLGSSTIIQTRHFDADGFSPAYDVLLADDRLLRRRAAVAAARAG